MANIANKRGKRIFIMGFASLGAACRIISTATMGINMTAASLCIISGREMAVSFEVTNLTTVGRVTGVSIDVTNTTTRTSELLPLTMFDIIGDATPTETPVRRRAESA